MRSNIPILIFAVFTTSALTLHADEAALNSPPWDVAVLQSVKVTPTWGERDGKAREVYYAGEPFQGKPTRIFGYYAKPEGDGPFPAVLLVHGGGGRAFRAWAEHWSTRGYCALAMDLAGRGPTHKLPDGGPDQTDDAKFGDFNDENLRDMWSYHAVAAVIRGHNLLRSLDEVDSDRIAVTGISWGGYLTCIVAGLDDRLKAAVPVYGCGFLHENSVWKPNKFDTFTPPRRNRWVRAFDPSQYLATVKCPILFLNGTNDFAYPLDSYQKSYSLVTSPRTLSVQVRLRHGHIWTFQEVDAFIDTHLKEGQPLPVIRDMKQNGATVSAEVKAMTELKAASLEYAVAEGAWQQREWKSQPATLKENEIVATLPETRPLVYFLTVTDARGLKVTTPHQVLPSAP